MTTAPLQPQYTHPRQRIISTNGWILAWVFCGFALLGGCERPQNNPTSTSSTSPTTESQAVGAAIPTDAISEEVTNDVAPKQPLDLSRDALDQLEAGGSSLGDQTADRDNLLPDLFEGGTEKTGARTSGRVLMRDDAESLAEGVEGVEFKVEVPVN